MAKVKSRKKARGIEPVRIGVIGGSGLYNMPGLENARELRVKTPFGDPSDAFVVGTLGGKGVAFLARHARGHRFLPSEINYRANIHAMKQLGVERIVSVSAVGSLQEDLKPLDFLIPDQFYDRTRHRVSTFCGDASPRTLDLRNPSAVNSQACLAKPAIARKCACTAAAHISAWKALNFPHSPKRTFIASCDLK